MFMQKLIWHSETSIQVNEHAFGFRQQMQNKELMWQLIIYKIKKFFFLQLLDSKVQTHTKGFDSVKKQRKPSKKRVTWSMQKEKKYIFKMSTSV